MGRAGTWLAAAGLLAATPVIAADEIVRVPAEQARCIARHLKRYEAVKRSPIIVFVELCPTAEPTPQQVAALNRNASTIRIQESAVDADERRAILVLSRAQLRCFARIVRRNPRVERDGTMRIALGRCG